MIAVDNRFTIFLLISTHAGNMLGKKSLEGVLAIFLSNPMHVADHGNNTWPPQA